MRGDRQIAYIDSITIHYRVYTQPIKGSPHSGRMFAKVQFYPTGEYIRWLPGEQQQGESGICPSALTSLTERIATDKQRVLPLIDPSPFDNDEDDDDDQ